jgi:hypothetical protein
MVQPAWGDAGSPLPDSALSPTYYREGPADCKISIGNPYKPDAYHARGAAKIYCWNGSYLGTTPIAEVVGSSNIQVELQVRNEGSSVWHTMDWEIHWRTDQNSGRVDSAGENLVTLTASCDPSKLGYWRVRVVAANGYRLGTGDPATKLIDSWPREGQAPPVSETRAAPTCGYIP